MSALPHPRTGDLFESPVPPGTGWPGDPADASTPVATTGTQVADLALSAGDLGALDAVVSVCRACPRLVSWRERVAVEKRASFADQPYWGRPVPSFGDARARLLVIGLAPAAHGANRTGRMFTGDTSGDWLYAALNRAGLASTPGAVDARDGLELRGCRILSPVRCAPPANRPTVQERHTCSAFLDRELALLPDARAALCLGAMAWTSLLAAARRIGWTVPRPAPRFGHGARARLLRPDASPLEMVGCYHVSRRNTSTGRLTAGMLDRALAVADRCSRG
ncbi:uracil-DNA glycosylase [Acidipropionibacterium acidipropionici]|uniref:uracil-DNA glycosylase n=1 Tax=Acidipropionibacterium acidipropionici TaxID=1748 RepID=UPI0004257AFC|nr:uracil-DNA glycosylase [Acidipropionibacterium acidipropionici]ALN16051.1 uracil-DNA glycosylase [Acidipropionibacterium acidipropionici]APZ08197.1 uracil-DNA glycosylase [Acidipropionibacterium acidipropionici]